MSKLNAKGISSHNGQAFSKNGNLQELKGPEQQLYELTVTTLYGKDGFYESINDRVQRLTAAVDAVVKKGNLDFIANVIVHARTVMNIRTMPVVLTVLFTKALRDQKKTYSHLRSVVKDVIQRADQITDLYAYALQTFGEKKAIPMAIKRGVADAFNKFNEYGFAKYNRDGSVKLRDVLFIVHPKAKDVAQGAIFEKIRDDKLEVPYTWETVLSRNGQLPESERVSKKDLWTQLVSSGEMGYMALLRNLRNIGEAGLDKSVLQEHVYNRIQDPAEVKKSKQFPFAFVNAYEFTRQVGDNKLTAAISRALDASLANVPVIGENIWIIIDCSGSMGSFSWNYYGSWDSRGRGNDNGSPIKTASLFGAALAKANRDATNLKITMFSNHAEHVSVNTEDSVMSIQQALMDKVYGGGTNLEAALNLKNKLGFEPDTVIVLSDMEVDSLSTKNVAKLFNDDCVKIAINLNCSESTPIGEKHGWYQLAGWSDKLFDFIPAMRNKVSVVQTLSVPYLGMGVRSLFR